MIANTHRATGRARIPFTLRPLASAACGITLTGAALFGTLGGAQAATINTPEAAPAVTTAASHAGSQVAAQLPSTNVGTAFSNLDASALLLMNSKGNNVQMLQGLLNNNGANLEEDGVYGPLTDGAVRGFQESNGLKVDGIVGPQTRGALTSGDAKARKVSNSNAASASTDTSDSSASSASTASSTSTTSSTTASSSSGEAILAAARSQIGTPYVWGGTTPGVGLDCSGLTQYAYAAAGISIPRTSEEQTAAGRIISESEAQVGDLVSWGSHIGIYAGNGKVVDAGSTPHAVTERSIWGSPVFVTFR